MLNSDPGAFLTMNYTFEYLQDHPILDATVHPSLGGNINGPSLIRIPDWVANPLGKYYLYFAHHEGDCIRLAVADSLTGPWVIYQPGALSLHESLFCTDAPKHREMHPDVQASIASGVDGDYPHIASPDMHIDSERKIISMYYHGRNRDGTQQTRRAESSDGITFTPLPPLLGDSYFRVFEHHNYHYAIAWGSKLYRSADGGYSFEPGPRLTNDNYRHGAILKMDGQEGIHVIWSRAGDCPESLLISSLLMDDEPDSLQQWHQWQLGETNVLHKPERSWEGNKESLTPSRYGGTMNSVYEIRDPCIFQEDGEVYLLYCVRGEQGIAIARLAKS